MFLKRLYIHNYKSFYHTEIEFDKLNIFVGENNVGKSNLIDVLEFYDLASKDTLQEAVSKKGGFEKLLNYHYDEKEIILEFEFLFDKLGKHDYILKLRLRVSKNIASSAWIFYKKKKNKYDLLYIEGSRYNYSLKKETSLMLRYFKLGKEPDGSILWILKTFFAGNFFQSYYFNPNQIRKFRSNNSDEFLLNDASNLGKILYDLKENYPVKFDIVSNSLIGTVKELDGIDVKKVFNNYLVGFYEDYKKEPISIEDVSDGTINLIATITALNQNTIKTLLAFEEPERHLHLKAINYLLDSFRNSDKQIIITTHSTEILKYSNLKEVIFLYRDSDGDTQAIRADEIEGLEDKLKNLAYERYLTLDELITDGIIGDFE